jgi:hypothetical protein
MHTGIGKVELEAALWRAGRRIKDVIKMDPIKCRA